jgi:predicted DNA-binding transcriptional regulator AlpA
MKHDEPPRYIKECEVSRITGLALQTLRNYRANGIGPVYCKIGRSVRYPLTDLLSWLEAHRVQTSDAGPVA